MKIPKRIQPLVDEGLVDEVLRPLMSGKEASVYIVRCGEDIRCAKVYKEVDKLRFKVFKTLYKTTGDFQFLRLNPTVDN